MSEPRPVGTTAIARDLRRWLFSGACQSESGAFCAWRDVRTGHLAFEYPEITGYLLTFAAGLDDLQESEVAAARRGADWLVSRLRRGDRSAREGWDGGTVYTFDLAMVATGLMSFGRLRGDEYLEWGVKLVRFLVAESEAAGKMPAVARGLEARHTGWATEGRAHLLKLVQCLLLADELGIAGARDCARALIGEASSLQQSDGRFVTDLRDDVTMLHPHHYALEGLWIWGRATSEQWALERAQKGVEWAFAHQLASSGFPRFVSAAGREKGPEQADATAQAIRMAGILDLESERLGRGVARLGELTIAGAGARAMVYQPAAATLHENTWATLFAAEALMLRSTLKSAEWRCLV